MGLLNNIKDAFNKAEFTVAPNKKLKTLSADFKKAFEKYDLLLGPTNTNVAYPFNRHLDNVLQSFYDDLLTIPVSMAGLPALALPVGFNNENLPIGLQIIGNYFKEEVIYELASFLENELKLDLKIGSDK